MTLASTTLAALAVLAISAAVVAYPLKEDDPFYFSRLHDLNKDNIRNLDGIDARQDSRPPFVLLGKIDQEVQSVKGPHSSIRIDSGSHLDGIGGGHLVRDSELDQGGGNLMRDLDILRNRAAFFSRGNRDQDETKKQQQMAYHFMDPLMGNTLGTAKRGACCGSVSAYPYGDQKRNMDEIDRSSFNSFNKKNFDEIDRSGFGSFAKKNFDEIDHSGFGKFVKRSIPQSGPELPQN